MKVKQILSFCTVPEFIVNELGYFFFNYFKRLRLKYPSLQLMINGSFIAEPLLQSIYSVRSSV